MGGQIAHVGYFCSIWLESKLSFWKYFKHLHFYDKVSHAPLQGHIHKGRSKATHTELVYTWNNLSLLTSTVWGFPLLKQCLLSIFIISAAYIIMHSRLLFLLGSQQYEPNRAVWSWSILFCDTIADFIGLPYFSGFSSGLKSHVLISHDYLSQSILLL